MKMYESIKRPDNYDKFKEPFKKGDIITIQEKIDGSNTSIYNDNGTLRLFSRTQEITNNKDNFQDFIKFVKENENNILNNLPNQYVLFGEWLGQAKIPYNKKAKNGIICPYYIFDIASSIENMNDENNIKRNYLSIKEAKTLVNKIGFEFVPTIVEEMIMNEFNELIPIYVENKKSLIDEESIREGIVIKTIDGLKRIKIVATQFSEVKQKSIKILSSENEWLNKYITPMRIQKFLLKIQESKGIEKLVKEDYKIIFGNLDLLSDDILNEELEQIKISISKLIKKQSINAIKEYLDNDNKDLLNNEVE